MSKRDEVLAEVIEALDRYKELNVVWNVRKHLKTKINYLYWYHKSKILNQTITVFYDQYGFGWSDVGALMRKSYNKPYAPITDRTLFYRLAYDLQKNVNFYERKEAGPGFTKNTAKPTDLDEDVKTLHIWVNQSF